MTDEARNVSREEYRTTLVFDHVKLGFSEDIAGIIADAAITFADDAQQAISDIGERVLAPLRAEYPAIVAFAALNSAAHLLAARMGQVHQQAGEHMQLLMTPVDAEETKH